MKCTEKKTTEMYESKSLVTEKLIRCFKLLKYDFFRVYDHHLIIYASTIEKIKNNNYDKKNDP